MVNGAQDYARAAERALALSYAPAARRETLATLFALDDRLGAITRAARDPTIGLMRLTWWADALVKLDTAPPPAEPLLRALAADVLPLGVSGAALESVADAWMRHLDAEPVTLSAYQDERGAGLFASAARMLGVVDQRVDVVGQGWALAEVAREVPAVAAEAAGRARERLGRCFDWTWPRALRPLSALGLLARFDVEGKVAPGDPRRVGRLLWHRLTGR